MHRHRYRLGWRQLPLALVLLILVSGLVAWAYAGPEHQDILDFVHSLHAALIAKPWVSGTGLVLFSAVAVGIGLPGAAALVLVTGYLFGVGIGLIICLIGCLAGATLTRAMVRLAGWRFGTLKLPLAWNGAKPFLVLVCLRAVPILPFTLVSVAGSMMRLGFLDYCAATLLGSLPPLIILTTIGQRFSVHINKPGAPSVETFIADPGLWISAAALGLLVLFALLFRARLRSRIRAGTR